MRTVRERGMALIAVLFTMILMMGLGAALHATTMGETALRGSHSRATLGFYAAEAGINRAMAEYGNIFKSYSTPTAGDYAQKTFSIGPRTVKYQLSFPPATCTGGSLIANGCGTGYSGCQVVIPAGKTFSGLNSTACQYTARSTAALAAHINDIEANLGNEFDIDTIPIFQFLAFYQNDLEILPGPTMTLHGPIHSNGNLYLNAVNTVTIADLQPTIPTVHITAAKDVYRGRKDTSSCTGTVSLSKLVDSNHDGTLDLQTMACPGGSTAKMTPATLATWLGSIKASQPTVAVPQPGVFARGDGVVAGGNYWLKADLRIVLRLDQKPVGGMAPIVVEDAGGAIDAVKNAQLQNFFVAKPGRIFYNDVPSQSNNTACNAGDSYCNRLNYAPNFTTAARVYGCWQSDLTGAPWSLLGGGCPAANNIVNELLADGVSWTARRGGFFNNREKGAGAAANGRWVWMLNVNAHDLLAWNRAQGGPFFNPDDASEGGIVLFLSVQGAGSTSNPPPDPRYGVRVFGSPDLSFPTPAGDPTGLTVVSDQAVYLEGDYNIGRAGFPKMPAAVMGDTINVLSAGWSANNTTRNDYQSRQTLCARPGASTTVNAAFIGGVDTTTAGSYNGGFENYPRFHENWGGNCSLAQMTLTYRGSFVSLGIPQHNNGAWCGTGGAPCDIYNPPTRAWDFDTAFQQVQNLPPMTPEFVSVQQILFTENFR